MGRKTQVNAENGKQEIVITRDFDLPLELLFRAYSEPALIEQWMGTRVLKFENKKYGGWQIETKDPKGNVAFRANGVIHEFIPNQKITRTFEMEGSPFGVQLEFLEFEKLTEETSRFRMQSVFRSAEMRDKLLSMPFAAGLNMAHDRLQEIVSNPGTYQKK